MTTVYVVERDVYTDRYVEGVYASPEAAMKANPISDAAREEHPLAHWHQIHDGMWDNGCDFGFAGEITAYPLEDVVQDPAQNT